LPAVWDYYSGFLQKRKAHVASGVFVTIVFAEKFENLGLQKNLKTKVYSRFKRPLLFCNKTKTPRGAFCNALVS